MRLDPSGSDWVKIAVMVIGVPLLVRRTYTALASYPAWRSPWKRMLVLAPLVIVTMLGIVIFFVVSNE